MNSWNEKTINTTFDLNFRLEQLSKLCLELAHHIGLVLHEEDSTVLSHPTVMHFMQLFHLDPLENSLPKVIENISFDSQINRTKFVAYITAVFAVVDAFDFYFTICFSGRHFVW